MEFSVRKQLLSITFFVLALVTITGTSFAGKVVFLHGTGCAGKTSLCSEILKQSDRWRMVNEDDIFYEEAAQRWETEFPEEFDAVEGAVDPENVLHAVMRNQVLFRSNAPHDKRLKAKKAIRAIQESLNSHSKESESEEEDSWSNTLRRQIAHTIMDLAKTYHVMVDTWFLKPEHIEQISNEYSVVHVAAYCPFLDIVKRTIKRNSDALMNGKDISNLRFFHQALKSFTALYELSDTEKGSIDSLNKDSVVRGLDFVELCLQDSPDATGASKTFTRGEFSLEEFEAYRQELIGKFKSETAYVVPQFKYDILVRTDQKSSAECAKSIIQNESP